jgi:predicted nucleic acid-binding Zn ribbon protein
LAPLEKAGQNPARSLADIAQRVLKKELQLDAQVVKAWNDLIDPTLVAHAQPVGLRKGTLFVNVDSSVWLSEIVRYRRREILERLQHSFGRELIAKISFRVG